MQKTFNEEKEEHTQSFKLQSHTKKAIFNGKLCNIINPLYKDPHYNSKIFYNFILISTKWIYNLNMASFNSKFSSTSKRLETKFNPKEPSKIAADNNLIFFFFFFTFIIYHSKKIKLDVS